MNKNYEEAVTTTTQSIKTLVEDCLHNFTEEELEVVQDRMRSLIVHQSFWMSNKNSERFLYELRQFANWLCQRVGEVEGKFWSDEQK